MSNVLEKYVNQCDLAENTTVQFWTTAKNVFWYRNCYVVQSHFLQLDLEGIGAQTCIGCTFLWEFANNCCANPNCYMLYHSQSHSPILEVSNFGRKVL